MSLQQHIQEQIQEQCEKHERINLIPAEVANVGVRVTCAEGLSDLCQKNAEVMFFADSTKCIAEGPGTKAAEVNKAAQFTVRTVYRNGQLCEGEQVVEAELKSVVKNSFINAKVTSKGKGVYEVTYTPEVCGRHTLSVRVNGTKIGGSPFQVFAKIHPTQLGEPVRVVEGVNFPWGIALNSKQQLVIAEWYGKKVMMFDKDGKKVQTITHKKFLHLAGVAVDKSDNIYVSDYGSSSLFKFSKEGKLMKVAGRKGTQPVEVTNPSLVKVINDKLYVCDRGNHRVQILNTELEYMNSFGCYGNGDGHFNIPNDIAQDGVGNLFVADVSNNRVQIFDCKGKFLSTFSTKGASSKPLDCPASICIGSDQLIYISDNKNKCVSVFETSGEFVTSFDQFSSPVGIVTDVGFLYISNHERIGNIYIL